jgi:uridylate kinase
MATSSTPVSEQPASASGLRRILLKLSGEALMGQEDYGVDPKMLKRVALEIREVMSLGMQVAVVIGGGNIFRGAGLARAGMDRDTAASLRAIEINADLLLKATKVNGIYSDDPMKNPAATRYARLTFDKVLMDRLNVMDATAIVMCRDNNLPLRVFDLTKPGELLRIVRGEEVGTLVTNS